ncbi:MAG: recombinase [Verrucomicrobia bacterium]|nr:recombinase [Verrucomicrobiota bacterium]
MKDDYEEYEKACGQIRKENGLLLDDFVRMLRSQRLALSTIKTHRGNVDFFINEFLLYERPQRPADGIDEISEFLGDWFIRKAMWSTPRHIKANATSLYRFYAFLASSGKVTLAEMAELKKTIVMHLPEWQARCERYNDVEIDDWRRMS